MHNAYEYEIQFEFGLFLEWNTRHIDFGVTTFRLFQNYLGVIWEIKDFRTNWLGVKLSSAEQLLASNKKSSNTFRTIGIQLSDPFFDVTTWILNVWTPVLFGSVDRWFQCDCGELFICLLYEAKPFKISFETKHISYDSDVSTT